MSRIAILALVTLVTSRLARADPRPAPRPSKSWPAGVPIQAALTIVNNDDDDIRLALADLRTGVIEELGKIQAEGLVWSPDGSLLAYTVGDTVTVRRMVDGQTITVPASLIDNRLARRYSFSPDGRWLVTLSRGRFELFASPGFKTKKVLVVPADIDLVDSPTWLHDRQIFAATGAAPATVPDKIYEDRLVVVNLELSPPSVKAIAIAGTDWRLLGVRKDRWVVASRYDGGVDAIGDDGRSEILLPADPSDDPYQPESYIEARDALVLGRLGMSDISPTQMILLTLAGGGHRRPWLRRLLESDEYTFTDDGRWVLYTVGARVPRGENGNNALYMAAADGTKAIRVLAPRTRTTSYGGIAIRPSVAP